MDSRFPAPSLGSRWLNAARRLSVGAAALLSAVGAWAQGPAVDAALTTVERRELLREGRVIVELLQNLHYSNRQFHEIESKEIIDQFVRRIDPERLIFTAEDVAALHRRFDRSLKNVYLAKGDVQPAFEIFGRFRARALERLKWAEARLEAEMDFEAEGIYVDAKEGPAAADEGSLDRRWELRLKHAVIREIVSGRDLGRAKAEVRRSFERWGKHLEGLSAAEVREQFWEALIGLFDPHSGYFGPERAEEFSIMMKGAVAGVGLEVWMDEGKCLVAAVLKSGPADRQGAVRAGDEIVALAEEGGEWQETKGRRLQEIVATLRGKQGRSLRVAYRSPGDEERKEVSLERSEVVLTEQRARGGVSEVPSEQGTTRKIGWIELPDFYASGVDSSESSATRDVRELVEQMKGKGVEGIVVDLRRNPGGAMTEAIALTGLFISAGPVMITRGMDGKSTVHQVEPREPLFTGPLVVLTSRQSASASEIFAGALQYHRRAVIVGAAATFGKGTAQNYIDLNLNPLRAGSSLPWGTLRVTGQRFYLPDGRSPQREGTKSDIVLPYGTEVRAEYEADLPGALKTDTIVAPGLQRAAGEFARVSDAALEFLRVAVKTRTETWPEWTLKRRSHELAVRTAERKAFSVQLAQRRKAHEADEAEINELWREVRAMTPLAYAEEELEIEAVRKVAEEHESLVRERVGSNGVRAGWLRGNRFFVEDAGGRLREARVDRMEFPRYAGEAPVLAEEFSRAAGLTMEESAMASVLRELSLVERMGDEALLACFAEGLGKETARANGDDLRVRRGAEAVLRKLTEIDGSLLRARPLIDVGLRESLRVVADWAEWRGENDEPDAVVAGIASLGEAAAP